MTPLQFEARYGARWDELEAALARLEGDRKSAKAVPARDSAHDPARVAALYRSACEHLALARSRDYPVPLRGRSRNRPAPSRLLRARRPAGC